MRLLAALFFLASPLWAQNDPVSVRVPVEVAPVVPVVAPSVPGGAAAGAPHASSTLSSRRPGASFGAKSFSASIEEARGKVTPVPRIQLGGVEGDARVVEIDGVQWVRKWWPASRQAPLARVQNELFFHQLIAAYEADTFDVVDGAVAQPDGSGGWYYYTRFREGAAKDDGRYETGLTERQRVKLAALHFVWSLGDLHASNVLFTEGEKPLLLDFEMVGDNGAGISNAVFDRSALNAPTVAAVQNLVYFKQQPYFMKQTKQEQRMEPYAREVAVWRGRLADPAFRARLLGMLRQAHFSDGEIEAYLGNVKANLDNFERNFKPFLDEVNEIVKRRQKLQSNFRSLRYFLGAGALDSVALAGDSYFALSRNS